MASDWDENLDEDRGHPLLATLVGGALLVAGGALAPQLMGHPPFKQLLLLAAAAALALWLIGFALTTRRAGLGWKAGSLVLLVTIAIVAAVGAFAMGEARLRGDASTVAEMDFAVDGSATFPRGAGARGPISQMLVADAAARLDEQRRLASETGALGVAALNSPYVLAGKPGILDKCDAIAALKTRAAEIAREQGKRRDALVAAIEALDQGGAMKRALEAALPPEAEPNAWLARRSAMLDATEALCTLLAKRSWSNAAGYFGFASTADRTRFRELNAARSEEAAALAALEREGRARMTAGREQVRDALAQPILSEVVAALRR